MNDLDGKRILIVDDESLIALHAEDILLDFRAIPVGPCGSVEDALSLIDKEALDAVLLDANLNGKSSEPIARRLTQKGIPFVVVTGYGKLPWPETAPVLSKPYNSAEIHRALCAVIFSSGNHS